ncbi:Gx transporter family protein [Treponema putidum]|uniref:Gx transporter family protein n=2 Tax=Treponema putidum TaxID=221027 RepID=A0ABY5HUT7_9SPIR|nr:Gx transporter family protein [Treponema putidum]
MQLRMLGLSLKTKKADSLIPLFGGFCFFLSAIEIMIPKPVPFFRMGLANLPLLLGIDLFSFPAFILLLAIKVLGQALISGTLFSYVLLFSAVGTFSSGLLMYAMRKIPRKAISFMGISLAGAFVSNSLQFLLAVLIMFGKSAVYIIPPVFSLGAITAVAIGWFASEFEIQSVWYQRVKAERFDFVPDNSQEVRLGNDKNGSAKTTNCILRDKYLRIGSGISLFLILLFVPFLPVQALVLGAALILCAADKQKLNFLNLIFMFTAITVFNLFPPMGKIIFSIGSIDITNQALLRGFEKAIVLIGMIYISKWMLKAKMNFKSRIGKSIQEAFNAFYKLLSVKHEIKPKMIIPTIDSVLLSINKL